MSDAFKYFQCAGLGSLTFTVLTPSLQVGCYCQAVEGGPRYLAESLVTLGPQATPVSTQSSKSLNLEKPLTLTDEILVSSLLLTASGCPARSALASIG